ncbi:hypothetical protein RYX45_25880, partial [Alkalihalophilus pseudofirmus]|nr:hypothetical protein [Alkalihalophilus pseudofirmus]
TLKAFLTEYFFKDLHGVFPLSDMVLLLFTEKCQNTKEQCQKAMRRWEEEFSEPLAVVIHSEHSTGLSLNQKYLQT